MSGITADRRRPRAALPIDRLPPRAATLSRMPRIPCPIPCPIACPWRGSTHAASPPPSSSTVSAIVPSPALAHSTLNSTAVGEPWRTALVKHDWAMRNTSIATCFGKAASLPITFRRKPVEKALLQPPQSVDDVARRDQRVSDHHRGKHRNGCGHGRRDPGDDGNLPPRQP